MRLSNFQKRELSFLKGLGVIPDDSEGFLIDEMEKRNHTTSLYGIKEFSRINFPNYYLAKKRMDFVFERLPYDYLQVTSEEMSAYYDKHKDEFLKENGEYFPFHEVKLVIRKRIREEEYVRAVNELFC